LLRSRAASGDGCCCPGCGAAVSKQQLRGKVLVAATAADVDDELACTGCKNSHTQRVCGVHPADAARMITHAASSQAANAGVLWDSLCRLAGRQGTWCTTWPCFRCCPRLSSFNWRGFSGQRPAV
jgi:hypothetical protein